MFDAISRRSVLRTGTAAATVGALAVGERAIRAAAQEGQSRAVDVDDDGERELQLLEADDPSEEGRGDVLHATSEGATTDYAVSIVNLAPEQLTLGDLLEGDGEDGDDAGVAYDYYVGEAETGMAPDEAWFVVHPRGNGGRRLLFKTLDDSASAGEWLTRDVSAEITGEGNSSFPWKEFHPDGRRVERFGPDLLEVVDADAVVRGLGVGRGTPSTGATVADTYYDRFAVLGEVHDLPTTARGGRGNGEGDGNDGNGGGDGDGGHGRGNGGDERGGGN